ncbi:MAG: PAS domain S-box protein [Deltaproteobacteria bacterium]|nr:PAS domain S-box protein [Deltaproteobacteria bacterium]
MDKKPTYKQLTDRVNEYENIIGDLKSSGKTINRLNLVLRTIRNINQLLVKEKDRTRLLQGICDNLVENRGYYNVWVATLDESGKLLTSAESGLGKEFFTLVERLKRGEMTQCGRTALGQSTVVLTRDPLTECRDCPLSKKYAGRSAITVRMEHDGKICGILSVSIPIEVAADQDEYDLLKEVSKDIAFGLHTIEMEEEHYKADEVLRESEKRFRGFIENSLVGICIVKDNQIIYQNPEQQKLLGSSTKKPKLLDIENIYPDDVEKVKEFYGDISSGKVYNREMEFRFYPVDRAGNRLNMKWVHCRANTFDYWGNEAILINMLDMTQTKELENILRVQDKMSSLGRVSAGIAHEIRNPLSGINIYLDTLEKLYNREDSREKMSKIIKQLQLASNKIESVIRRVMDFSKPGEPTFISINAIKPIEEAIDLSAVTLRKRGIKLDKVLTDIPPIKADPSLLEQVMLNLITNAAEAMKNLEGEKKIEISAVVEGDRILVKISDSGPGVPLHLKDKIFDPFYTTKKGSTGIGLSLSRRIIMDHQGSLEVSSSKWGGAEFRIEIPIENS